MPQFHFFKEEEIQPLLSLRGGEQKLGECIGYTNDQFSDLKLSNARFVIVGLPEDIGVRANYGIGGADTSFQAFLKSFLNIQETEFLSGNDFLLSGFIKTDDLEPTDDIEELRTQTSELDKVVAPIITEIVASRKIPIVIGGGHNNVFPILKGCSIAKEKVVNVINLDAHSDFRKIEGRHSGNGFRYAYQEKSLKKYALLGLHEAYNAENIVEELNTNPDFLPLFWEDIFLRNKLSWNEAIQQCLKHSGKNAFGVELDLDAIEKVLTSAFSPVGISKVEAMQYLYQCGKNKNALYVHLPEGITNRNDGVSDSLIGKLQSYLVQAFCKGVLERA